MSYEPSHRKPPRQERWPNATPQGGWPAPLSGGDYPDRDDTRGVRGEDHRGWAAASYQDQPGYRHPFGPSEDRGYRGYRPAAGTDAFAGTTNGYGTADRYADASNGYAETASGYAGTASGYGDARQGSAWAGNGYRDATGDYVGGYDGYAGTTDGYPGATDGFDVPANGYGSTANGHVPAADGYRSASDGFNGAADPFDRTANHFDGAAGHFDGYGSQDGYAEAHDPFAGSAGYLDQLDQDGYSGRRPSGPLLIAPDTFGERGWLPDRGDSPDPEPDRTGLIVGAVTGFLAAAVAIGVATLAAAFVRPQASPIIAVGGAFIDRTPPALKNFAVEHFGENDKTILLLGMYVTIALIAMAIGCLARRSVTIGVAGIAAFGLFGAFVAITRPESHATDVIPSVIGGIAGVLALLWLDRAAAPVAPLRHAHGIGHRGAR
jgi:hypothetical protein